LHTLISKYIANNTGNYKIYMNINLPNPFIAKENTRSICSEFVWSEAVLLLSFMMIPSSHALHTSPF